MRNPKREVILSIDFLINILKSSLFRICQIDWECTLTDLTGVVCKRDSDCVSNAVCSQGLVAKNCKCKIGYQIDDKSKLDSNLILQ